jgi:ankyrin repeat protein
METLAAAINAGDAARVAEVLARHPELKSQLDDPMPGGHFGATPLLTAVSRNNREIVDALLAAGANINQRSHWWAGSFGVLDNESELALYLIERGAVVDAYAAARHGMLDRLQALVAVDPNVVHMRGGDGQTPLHVAANVDIARFLHDHGADIDARDVDHESTPAQYLVRDNQAVVRYLVDRGCRTDILMVATLGDTARVRRHLDENPACIGMRVSEEWFPKQNPRSGGSIYIWTLGAFKTAHLLAREFGHDDVYRVLMERSPDALKLAVACQTEDEASVNALLAARPNLVESMSESERRNLTHAAEMNSTQAVRRMLRAGWPVDARTQGGATALHWAGFHGNLEMARELLRHNAPVDVRDREYDGLPLGWAIYGSKHSGHCKTGNHAGVVDALLGAGAARPKTLDGIDASDEVIEVLRHHSSQA